MYLFQVARLNGLLGGAELFPGQFLLDCTTTASLPTVSLSLSAGVSLLLHPEDYVLEV